MKLKRYKNNKKHYQATLPLRNFYQLLNYGNIKVSFNYDKKISRCKSVIDNSLTHDLSHNLDKLGLFGGKCLRNQIMFSVNDTFIIVFP